MLSTGYCTVSSKRKNDKKRRREKPKSTEQIVNGLMSEMPGNMKVDAGKRKLPSLHGELPSKQRRENIKWADEDGRDIESTMLIPTRYQMAELHGWSYYYNPDYHPRENRATISSEEKSGLRRSVEIPDDWKFFDADKPSNCPLSEFPMTSMLSTGYCTVSSKKKNDKKRRREKPKSTEQIVNDLMNEMPGNMKVDAGKRKLPSLHGELPSKQRRKNIKWADEDGRDIESTMLIPTRYQMAELYGWSYYYNPDYHPRENRATISSEEKSWLRRSVEIPDDWEFFDADKPSNCPLSEFPMTSMLSTGCCTVSSKKKNDKKRRREKTKSTEQIVNGLLSEMLGNMKLDAGKRKLPSLHGELPSKQQCFSIAERFTESRPMFKLFKFYPMEPKHVGKNEENQLMESSVDKKRKCKLHQNPDAPSIKQKK
ncbi:hypothetical protein ACOME3_000869 [Neoechinorhynchus agilis]